MRKPPPERLPYTGDDEADALIASDAMALLIGFTLDQQVSVQKAFSGPLDLQRRIGSLDPAVIAAMDQATLEAAFRGPPALHRFPANMARRTQELCGVIAERYGGDAARIWTDAASGPDLRARLLELPGIGKMKADAIIAILGKHYGFELPGMDAVMPLYPTLGDVDSPERLAEYQAMKRASKEARKAAAATADAD